MLSLKKNLESLLNQVPLYFPRKIVGRFFYSILLMIFSLSVNALTINVLEYSEDGNYTISWSGGRYSTEVRELKDGVLEFISDKTSGNVPVSGKAPGVYTYSFKDCYVRATQTSASIVCEEPIYKTVYVSPSEPLESIANKEITPYNYDVYRGDLNGDGKSDYYFDGKKQIILLHGDIAIPVTILPPSSFIVMKDGNSYLSPELLKLTANQISAKITANTLRKLEVGSDYYVWSDEVSGQSKVLLRGSSATEPSLLLLSAATTQTPTIDQVFQPNANANLSNSNLSIGFNDFNADGRKDLDINGYTYLSNTSGSINATPVIKTLPPSSVTAGLDFMTGVPWVTWPLVANVMQYEVREMLNGYPTGVVRALTANNATFASLAQLGTYTYEVRACKLLNGAPNCSNWLSSNGVKSNLTVAPTMNAPMFNSNGIYNVSWSRVVGATRYELYENNVLIQNTSDLAKFFSGANKKITGTYVYQVRACGQQCGPASTLVMTTVTIGSNNVPVTSVSTQIQKSIELSDGNVDSQPILDVPTGAPVGTLAGQFRVNESGAATYDVSIAVPDGIAGVTPKVNLAYSSQGGKGLLGKGWSLGGLSDITRCRQTVAQDGQAVPITWSASDRFCLDGQRLILVSGSYGHADSQYKTEIDTYATVTAKGGTAGNPDYFKVEAKDGSVSIYGDVGSAGSSEVSTDTNGVFTWSLKHFKDNMGNPIVYVYEGNTTDHHIKEIRYAYGDQNPDSTCDAFIKFGYEGRPDEASAYVAGIELKNTKRLNKVSVYNGGCAVGTATLARMYKVNYDPTSNYSDKPFFFSSLVESIQECATDSVSNSSCYPATTFAWSKPAGTGYTRNLNDFALTGAKLIQEIKAATFMDINGNGTQDYIWSRVQSGLTVIQAQMDFGVKGNNSSPQLITTFATTKTPKFEVIDYNADGHQDLLIYDAGVKRWSLFLSEPDQNGWSLKPQATTLPFATAEHIKVGDVNSDGLVDVIELNIVSQIIKVYILEKRAGAGVTSSTYYAFNSSGVNYSLNNNPADGATFDASDEGFHFADFNGDGKVDIALKFTSPTIVEFRAFLSGIGNQWDYYDSLLSSSAGKAITKLNSVDINGDGLTDIAQYDGNLNCTDGYNGDSYSEINCTASGTGFWYYRLNTGAGFGAAVPISYQDNKQISQGITLVDINHDGYPDVVWRQKEFFPSALVYTNINPVYVKYWNSKINDYSAADYLYYHADITSSYQFLDVNGDSYTDIVKIEKPVGASSLQLSVGGYLSTSDSSHSGVIESDQITNIIDGLGNTTKISYEPLSRSSSYLPVGDIKVTGNTASVCHPGSWSEFRGYEEPWCENVTTYNINSSDFYTQINNPFNGLNADSTAQGAGPVLPVNSPLTLVTHVESKAPAAHATLPRTVNQQATSSVDYFYKHLRMQAAGRGMLGFASLITSDLQTGVTTETDYRQDWPYIGSPTKTVVKTSGGKVLSSATNAWANAAASNENYYQPFIDVSVTNSYSLNSDGSVSTEPLQTVTTDTDMTLDGYGNVDLLTVTTQGSDGNTQVKTTDNDFSGSPWQKRLGRLSSTTVSTIRNSQPDNTRRSVNFTYYPENTAQNGLLWTEVVEKNTPEELSTEYIYDLKGNKTEVRVTGLAEAGRTETRTTKNTYTSNTGRYLISTTNDENQSSEISARDPATGQPTNVSDINGVAAQVYYDVMGKEYLRVDGTGAWSRKDTSLCTSTCPTGAKFYTLTRVAGGGQSISYFDSLGRSILSSKVGFDGRMIHVETEYDKLGRTLRQSTPFFEGYSPGWTTNEYDLLGRVTKVTLPNESFSTSTYSGNTTTVINDEGHTRSEARNGLGQLVQVTDNLGGTIDYAYHTSGALFTTTTKAPDYTTPVIVRMCYDRQGRKISMLDPDKGGWLATSTHCSSVSASSPGWWKYTYNAFGELVTQRDPKSQITTMTYDKLGRMIKRVDEEQTRWFYDKTIDGASTAGSKGKLMAVVVRKDSSVITNCLGSDNCTQYFYDHYARPTDTLVLYPNDTTGYIASVKYDSIGRAYETRDALNGAVFNDSGVQTQFNQYGYAYRTIDIAPLGGGNGVLSEIKATNARGQVTEEWRNNSNFVTINEYNELTGLLLTQKATTALASMLGTTQIQDETYTWDTLGNLETRTNKNANVGNTSNKNLSETFYYDGLNRLISSTGSGSQVASCGSQNISYNGVGNITCKNGVGTYAYGVNAGPHAVTSTTLNGSTVSYQYDANGNMVQDSTTRTLTYTAYDMVKTIAKGSSSTAFLYGADRARWQRVDVRSGVTTTTTYLGNVERIQRLGASEVEWRRSVGGSIITFKTNTNHQLLQNATNSAFVFNDHLGSVDVITDASGKVTHSMSFDPWGARRSSGTWIAFSVSQRIAAVRALKIGDGTVFRDPITKRGFTGHEMVDDMDIIHMNGRIYDSKLGRFLQADPNIDGVTNTQGYNRYSYVQNNPLNATDPSGFFSLRKFVGVIVGAIATFACNGNPACGKAAYLWIGGLAGGAQAAATGGNILKGAITGMITAAVFHGIGKSFTGTSVAKGGDFWSLSSSGGAAHIFSHAMAGGILSVVQGGKFGSAFFSAGLTKGFDSQFNISGDGAAEFFGETVVNAVVGGTISELTGGKFANGAFTAAFQHLFNEMGERRTHNAAKVGAVAGGVLGLAASGACDYVSLGACVLANPSIIATGAAAGAITGEAVDRAWEQLSGLISKAVTLGPLEYQYALVAQTTGLYPDVRNGLVALNAGDVWKYGTSADPSSRYADSALRNLGLSMQVQSTGTKYQVLAQEKMQLIQYAVTNGTLPPGNKIFK